MALADLIRDLSASLKPPEEKERTHACHYVVEGQAPERCVLEYGRPGECVFATRLVAQGKDQTTCEYWRPLRKEPAPPPRPVERHQPARAESGHRESGHRESGHRESDHRESGHRESGHRESGHRESQQFSKLASSPKQSPAAPSSAPTGNQTISERLQDRESLIQAMIMREILDKPRALRRRR